MILCNTLGPIQSRNSRYKYGYTRCHLPAGHKGSHQCRKIGGGPPLCFPNGQYKEWVGFRTLEEFKPTLQSYSY